MSYDVSLVVNTGKSDHELDSFNYTYNVSPMFRHVFEGGTGIHVLHDKSADVACIILNKAINKMQDDYDDLILLNPKNGWGDYHGALSFLKEIKSSCEEHPNAVVKIS